jgi:hypothetical protein
MMQDRKGSDPGYPVPGTWDLGPDTRYRISAEGRTPSTEDRVTGTRDLGILHLASCTLHLQAVEEGNRRLPGWGIALLPYCLTALLPNCLIALLPDCLTALLPYCLIALLPYCRLYRGYLVR